MADRQIIVGWTMGQVDGNLETSAQTNKASRTAMTLEQSSENRLRVLAISGSLRTASFNTGLLRASREVAPDGMDVEIFDIRGLPFYDGDLESQDDPEY